MVAVVAIVLLLSLFTISKGYAYKHEVDPLPGEDSNKDDNQEEKEEEK